MPPHTKTLAQIANRSAPSNLRAPAETSAPEARDPCGDKIFTAPPTTTPKRDWPPPIAPLAEARICAILPL